MALAEDRKIWERTPFRSNDLFGEAGLRVRASFDKFRKHFLQYFIDLSNVL